MPQRVWTLWVLLGAVRIAGPKTGHITIGPIEKYCDNQLL